MKLISVELHQIHSKLLHFGNAAANNCPETLRQYVAKASAILDQFGSPISEVPDDLI